MFNNLNCFTEKVLQKEGLLLKKPDQVESLFFVLVDY